MNKNFFTFKNLGGNYPALENELRLGTPTAVFGVSEANKNLIASLSGYKVLYVTADAVSANKVYTSVCALSGKKCVLLPAKDEVILYKDALSKDALFRRLTAVNAIMDGAEITVCDIEAIMQLFPAKLDYVKLTVDDEYDYRSLPQKLVRDRKSVV